MSKAVFLDRDGVLNELVFNPVTGEYEPPHSMEVLKFYPQVCEYLKKIQDSGYDLFLVSNQPDYAKGKTTLGSLKAVHRRFDGLLKSHGVFFREYFYCYHHPGGIVSEYSYECICRKPKPFFLFKAEETCDIELGSSWMIGDQDTDIRCGQAGGTKTILIEEPRSAKKRGNSQPNYKVKNLKEAIEIILHTKTQN
jgi:D-glycero-D-manno-heptose 1,7-bisphosphate phosphatase